MTACAASPARPVPPPVVQAADPVIVTRTIERLHCPGDLDQVPADQPAVPAGAVIKLNDPAKAWLAALTAWGEALRAQVLDSQAACAAARLVDPAGLP